MPWLLGIASRLIRRHRAVEAKHWRSFTAAVTGEEHSSEGGLEAMGRIDAERRVQSMRSRIAALAPRDRETLLLYAWQGLTYEQIGEALGVPVGTVRSRLNRVRRRLDPGRGAQGVAQVVEIVEQGESNERV
jgi:RNA polymerase sigma-70 factor (ECF subfamily)